MRDGQAFGKFAVILLVGILVLLLIPGLFAGNGFGGGYGFRHNMLGGNFHMGAGYYGGFGGGLSVFLMFLVKFLFVLFVVGLLVGIGIMVKNTVFTEEDVRKIKSTFTSKQTTPVVSEPAITCSICGKALQPEWKLCPHCGKEKSETI